MRLSDLSIETIVAEWLSRIGGSYPRREGLQDTPRRFIAAWKHFLSGYTQDSKSILTSFSDGAEGYDELVFVGNIAFYSMCEHHLLPFFGVAHIGYIPNAKEPRIVGLSKLARLTDMYARRLQCQERMTQQIANALKDHIAPRAVGVCLRARHLCMESRGVQKPGTITYTSSLKGDFKNEASARSEFLKLVALADTNAKI